MQAEEQILPAYYDYVQFIADDGSICTTVNDLNDKAVICKILDREKAKELFDIIIDFYSLDIFGNIYSNYDIESNQDSIWIWDDEWRPRSAYKTLYNTLYCAFNMD